MFPYLLLWALFMLKLGGVEPPARWCETPALCGTPPENRPPIGDEGWPK
jgi:hypothetical protein